MNPILSVIIPCYNTEKTLKATLESVMEQSFDNWEAIIVNDGSPDNLEIIAKEFVEKDSRFIYLKKENGGLGSARNFGIQKSKGLYILPLDSDNLIEKDFVKKAVSVFKNNPKIGVVHGHAKYFGEKNEIWEVNKFNLNDILTINYIDACAIYRKSCWEIVGGYDQKMPYQGHEDWAFWIALGEIGTEFYHLKCVTFYYYFSKNSMIRTFTKEMEMANRDYIVKKFSLTYYENYVQVNNQKNEFIKKTAYQLKSQKYVLNLFTKVFFGFRLFKL